MRRCGFYIIYILIVVLIVFAAGEIYLRAISTPGFNYAPPATVSIERTYMDQGGRRVRFATSEKPMHPGRVRILMQGDSITASNDLPDCRDIFANRLLALLNQKGPKYEMSVYAVPGWEIDQHLKVLQAVGPRYRPDIIIYQWYLNDMELDKQVSFAVTDPSWIQTPVWDRLPGADWLKEHSYLWYFLGNRLRPLVYARFTYAQSLSQMFTADTEQWADFELYFRRWLSLAGSLAPRVIVYLYPGTNLGGQDPAFYELKALHAKVAQVASTDQMTQPGVLFPKQLGENRPDANSRFGKVRFAPAGQGPGALTYGPYMTLPPGRYSTTFCLKVDRRGDQPAVKVDVAGHGGVVLAARRLQGDDFSAPGQWKKITLEYEIKDQPLKDVEFRVEHLGGCGVSLDYIRYPWPLPQGIQVVDGAPDLLPHKTWLSPYDAHPNALASRLVARRLYRVVTGSPAPGEPK